MVPQRRVPYLRGWAGMGSVGWSRIRSAATSRQPAKRSADWKTQDWSVGSGTARNSCPRYRGVHGTSVDSENFGLRHHSNRSDHHASLFTQLCQPGTPVNCHNGAPTLGTPCSSGWRVAHKRLGIDAPVSTRARLQAQQEASRRACVSCKGNSMEGERES